MGEVLEMPMAAGVEPKLEHLKWLKRKATEYSEQLFYQGYQRLLYRIRDKKGRLIEAYCEEVYEVLLIAYVKALKGYNPEKNVPFQTYLKTSCHNAFVDLKRKLGNSKNTELFRQRMFFRPNDSVYEGTLTSRARQEEGIGGNDDESSYDVFIIASGPVDESVEGIPDIERVFLYPFRLLSLSIILAAGERKRVSKEAKLNFELGRLNLLQWLCRIKPKGYVTIPKKYKQREAKEAA